MTGTCSRTWATHRGMLWISMARPHPARAPPHLRAEPGARKSYEERTRRWPAVISPSSLSRSLQPRRPMRGRRIGRREPGRPAPRPPRRGGGSLVSSKYRGAPHRRFHTAPFDRSSVSSASTSGSARRLLPRKGRERVRFAEKATGPRAGARTDLWAVSGRGAGFAIKLPVDASLREDWTLLGLS